MEKEKKKPGSIHMYKNTACKQSYHNLHDTARHNTIINFKKVQIISKTNSRIMQNRAKAW